MHQISVQTKDRIVCCPTKTEKVVVNYLGHQVPIYKTYYCLDGEWYELERPQMSWEQKRSFLIQCQMGIPVKPHRHNP